MQQNKKYFLEIIGLMLKNFKLNFFLTYFYLLIFSGISYLLMIFNFVMYYSIKNTFTAYLFLGVMLVSLTLLILIFYFIIFQIKTKVIISYSNLILSRKLKSELNSLNQFLDLNYKPSLWNYFLNSIFKLFSLALFFGFYFFLGKYYLIILLLVLPLILNFSLNIVLMSFKENLLFILAFFKRFNYFLRFYILELVIYVIGYLLFLTNMPMILLMLIYCFLLAILLYLKVYSLFLFRLFYSTSK